MEKKGDSTILGWMFPVSEALAFHHIDINFYFNIKVTEARTGIILK
jgi:hypothetical protein